MRLNVQRIRPWGFRVTGVWGEGWQYECRNLQAHVTIASVTADDEDDNDDNDDNDEDDEDKEEGEEDEEEGEEGEEDEGDEVRIR